MEWFRTNQVKHSYRIQDIYQHCGIRKQSHYSAVKLEQKALEKEPFYLGFILEVRQMHPGMGLRTIYERYGPEGIGRDAFIELGLKNGFRLKAVHKTVRTTFSVKSSRYSNLLEGKRFTDVNQIWTSDITYIKIGETTYYIVFIMDVYSRRIVGYCVADNMRAEQNIKALSMALDLRGIKDYSNNLIHHSDKGSQYISNDYTGLLDDFGIQISMCNIVYENAHIERVNGVIKNQYLHHWNITTYMQLSKKLEKAVWAYNYEKPHSSLGKLSPVEFEESLREISLGQRKELVIYTHSQNDDKPLDLQLNFDF